MTQQLVNFQIPLFGHQPLSHPYEAPNGSKEAGYMGLRTTATDGFSNYDNPDELRNASGYDVPKGSRVGYVVPNNQKTGKTSM